MVKPAEDRRRDDVAAALDIAVFGSVAVEPEVSSVFVVVDDVLPQLSFPFIESRTESYDPIDRIRDRRSCRVSRTACPSRLFNHALSHDILDNKIRTRAIES